MGKGKKDSGKGRAAGRDVTTTPAASGAGAATDHEYWAVDASWTLLLLSLVLTPLLITNVSWLPGTRGEWLHGGAPMLKALTMQILVGAALACFCYALVRGRAVVRTHRVAWVAAAFLAWSGVTVLTSVSPATALVGYSANAQGLLTLAAYGAAAFLALQLADSPSRIRALLRTTALTAAAIAVYGLVQTLGLDPLSWKQGLWGAFRSFGTIGNPDTFGAYMVLNLFVLVALLLGETDARLRLLYGAASLVVAAATFTSLARAAWLAAIAGGIVFAVLAVRLKPRVTRMERILAALLVVAVCGAIALSVPATDVDSNVIRRAAAAFDPADKNTFGRTETWRIAAIAVGKRPLVGYGPDTFALAFQPNKTEAFARLVQPNIVQANAHSSFIQLAVESGLPGSVLWLVLLGGVAVVSLPLVGAREGKGADQRLLLGGAFASVAGYLVASLLSPTSPPLGLLLWCTLACLVSPAAATAKPGRWLAPAALAACAVGVTVAVLGAVLLYAGTRASIADDETVRVQARLTAADAAMRFDPFSAEVAAVSAKAYAQAAQQEAAAPAPRRGLVTARFASAYDAMRRSVALEPTDPHRRSTLVGLLLIGRAMVDDRYGEQAVTTAEEAVRVAPNDLEAAYWYARALEANGRGRDAVPVLERVLRLRADFIDAAVLLSDLYAADGDTSSAKAVLERAVAGVEAPEGVRLRLERLGGKSAQ